MVIRLLHFFFVLFLVGAVSAQDLHFSQYYASPMTLNPALTGKFNGLYRITGIYRGQSFTLINSASIYRTPSASVDFSLLKDKMNGNSLGVGVAVANDQQVGSGKNGAIKLNQTTAYLSVAYNLGFGRDKRYQLGLGFTPTMTFKNTKDDYIYPEELGVDANGNINPINSTGHETLLAAKRNFFNMSTGLFFNMQPKDWFIFYLGGTMANIFRPNVSFLDKNSKDVTAKLPFRFVAHGGFEIGVDKKNHKWVLIPGFLYQNMAKANEANAGLTVGYHILNDTTNNKKATIFFGLWNRMGSDVNSAFAYRNITPKIGFEYNRFRFGFAYDIDLGKMRADANSAGGKLPMAYELSLSYIGLGSAPPKERNWIFNPRF